jgi:hypothetical protein
VTPVTFTPIGVSGDIAIGTTGQQFSSFVLQPVIISSNGFSVHHGSPTTP